MEKALRPLKVIVFQSALSVTAKSKSLYSGKGELGLVKISSND